MAHSPSRVTRLMVAHLVLAHVVLAHVSYPYLDHTLLRCWLFEIFSEILMRTPNRNGCNENRPNRSRFSKVSNLTTWKSDIGFTREAGRESVSLCGEAVRRPRRGSLSAKSCELVRTAGFPRDFGL